MKKPISVLIALALLCFTDWAAPSLAQDENVASYYIVFQWPGSFCKTARRQCCYPPTGKPANSFTIAGLWPYTFSGKILTFCNNQTRFIFSKISELSQSLEKNWPSLTCPSTNSNGRKLWRYEWQKYGTCSAPFFSNGGEKGYFEVALKLKGNINLVGILGNTGIHPNSSFYSPGDISEAIRRAVGYEPGLVCNRDKDGKQQLHQILLCGDSKGDKIVDCLGFPQGKCSGKYVKFPSF